VSKGRNGVNFEWKENKYSEKQIMNC
jgi:hypothetical protein